MMNWEILARLCFSRYGCDIDWDNKFFLCPCCGHFIASNDDGETSEVCAVCKVSLTSFEENI